jgi:RNA polymerase-interacting CarD/CdnL/TRCF family regulator
MLIDIKSKIFYPSHGAGWVVGQKEVEFCGVKKQYYEFELINNPLCIATPIANLESLKIRNTNSLSAIKKLLKELKKSSAINSKIEDYNEFINTIKELDNEGEIKGFIKIIQYCNYIKKQRIKDAKVIPANIVKYVKIAKEYIVCELAVAGDIAYEDALVLFEKETGLKEA